MADTHSTSLRGDPTFFAGGDEEEEDEDNANVGGEGGGGGAGIAKRHTSSPAEHQESCTLSNYDEEAVIVEFSLITQLSYEESVRYIRKAKGNLETATELYFDRQNTTQEPTGVPEKPPDYDYTDYLLENRSEGNTDKGKQPATPVVYKDKGKRPMVDGENDQREGYSDVSNNPFVRRSGGRHIRTSDEVEEWAEEERETQGAYFGSNQPNNNENNKYYNDSNNNYNPPQVYSSVNEKNRDREEAENREMGSEEKLMQFMDITGEGPKEAENYLQRTDWDLERAVQIFYEGGALDYGPYNIPSNQRNNYTINFHGNNNNHYNYNINSNNNNYNPDNNYNTNFNTNDDNQYNYNREYRSRHNSEDEQNYDAAQYNGYDNDTPNDNGGYDMYDFEHKKFKLIRPVESCAVCLEETRECYSNTLITLCKKSSCRELFVKPHIPPPLAELSLGALLGTYFSGKDLCHLLKRCWTAKEMYLQACIIQTIIENFWYLYKSPYYLSLPDPIKKQVETQMKWDN